jgi:hypothetical protein
VVLGTHIFLISKLVIHMFNYSLDSSNLLINSNLDSNFLTYSLKSVP